MPTSLVCIPYFGKNALESLIFYFGLIIALRIVNRRKDLCNMKLFTKCLHILTLKIFTIIHDQSLWHTKLSNDIFSKEGNYLFLSDWFHWDSFHPFGGVFNSYDDKFMAFPVMKMDHTYQINDPSRKGPWRNNGVELLSGLLL